MSSVSEETPTRIGRYSVQAILGRGAMGIVYRAFDPIIERLVAIKVLHMPPSAQPQDQRAYLQQFYIEAKAAGRLNHPNIVAIYDIGEWHDIPYIVMELLEGNSLSTLIRGGYRPSWMQAAAIVRQVAEALAYAHDHGILHRDIKPGNIMLLSDGRVKVLDFGVARFLSHREAGAWEDLVGTPPYIAPELIEGQGASPASDLFSLGVVFYQLLTSRRPFTGDTFSALAYALLQTRPSPPSRWNPRVPPFLDTIVMRMIARRPEDRYNSAPALVQDLECLMGTTLPSLEGSVGVSPVLTDDEPTLTVVPRWRRWFWRMADFVDSIKSKYI